MVIESYGPKILRLRQFELDAEIAAIYQLNFPNDTVIIGDAHQYLLDHYKEFDFIWSSFPCTTHTRMNVNFNLVRFPDLGLYEEIIFLKHFFKGKFCGPKKMAQHSFLKSYPYEFEL